MSSDTKELVVIGNNWKVSSENGYLRPENGRNEATGALLGETAVVHLGSGGTPRTMIHRQPRGIKWEKCLIFSVFVLFFTSAISLLLLLTSNTCDINNIGKFTFILVSFFSENILIATF